MTRKIQSVAVLGSGTMGSGIAALCAGSGARVLLLDMPAKEGERNAIAAGAKERMLGGKAPMLDDPAAAERIEVGNFDDDLAKLRDYDWIVEVIVENLEAKRALFSRVEEARRDGSIVTSNTSGIMLRDITEGLPQRLRRDIAVTHFFNPVKVMKLVELVPGADTEREVIDSLADYLSGPLGKGVVWAKDTVNFIANRIGCFWMLAGANEAVEALDKGVSMEEIDAALGAPVGVPSTALFGLYDLVGLDVLGLVGENLEAKLPPEDPCRRYVKLPPEIQRMLARKQLGRKTGGGFYRMAQTAEGGRTREIFDLKDERWRPAEAVELAAQHRTLDGLLFADDALGRFAWTVMGGTLCYAAALVPDISEDVVNIDRAMRWGFAWKQGPFQMLDAVGPARVIARLRSESAPVPRMLAVLEKAGAERFYDEDGRRFLGVDGAWHPVP